MRRQRMSQKIRIAALPQIQFKGLAVVAFVQDDGDKRILHAVQASVPEAE